ncbi:MAG: hypothetical protein LV480_12520 [Methylacidiphilales bacterium]|nr:hypothetical protein [Candidatus Methylacidiphilales bacterium]
MISAIPFGLLALFGDLIFFQAMKEEVMNWNRRPHNLWWIENTGWMLLYFALINAGFLLLFGYARRAGHTPKPGNGIWIMSTIYNVIMAGLNGSYVHGQAPGTPLTSLLNPTTTGFWMIAVPLLGAILSLRCLGTEPQKSP